MPGHIYTAGDLARERRQAIEQCARIADDISTEVEEGEIYIATKIAERIRKLLPSQQQRPSDAG